MKVVSLPTASKQDALDVVDALRESVENGEAIAFACVALNNKDECFMFTSSVQPVTMLRMLGAINRLEFCYQNETIGA